MVIKLYGYIPVSKDKKTWKQDFNTFFERLDEILSSRELILSDRKLFFTTLSFAFCSWPYIQGSGPLCLGYLLSGWENGIFIESCPDCSCSALVTAFGGSPLSGSNSWSGYCRNCHKRVTGKDSQHKPFFKRVKYVLTLRQSYPATSNS